MARGYINPAVCFEVIQSCQVFYRNLSICLSIAFLSISATSPKPLLGDIYSSLQHSILTVYTIQAFHEQSPPLLSENLSPQFGPYPSHSFPCRLL